MAKRTDLKMPYGVTDFKTIRNEGLYYVDKTEHLAKFEERDRFVFFVRPRRCCGSTTSSTAIRTSSTRRSRRRLRMWALSAGTCLHCPLYQFKGAELIRLEEIAP